MRSEMGDLAAGTFTVEGVAPSDWLRIERLTVEQLATFDLRHFTVVRPRHVPALSIVTDWSASSGIGALPAAAG